MIINNNNYYRKSNDQLSVNQVQINFKTKYTPNDKGNQECDEY